jgi:signal transduction histidine kinase
MKHLVVLVMVALVAIIGYQTYWLVGLYGTLDAKLRSDVKEAIRKSDYEEMMHRIKVLRNRKDVRHGRMAISVNLDTKKNKASVSSKVITPQKQEVGLMANLRDPALGIMLGQQVNLEKFGLYMQRGIHSGLDDIQDIAPVYFDSLLTRSLDSLGLDTLHYTLLLHHYKEYAPDRWHFTDTVARLGAPSREYADTVRFKLNVHGSTEYVVCLPSHRLTLLWSMGGMLAASLLIVVIVAGILWFLIHTLMRLRTLDEMKSDFTHNMTHELKTPIAVAYAANDALLHFGGAQNPERLHHYLTISQQQLQRLSLLVEQILSMSMERRRSMVLNKVETNVAQVVESLAAQHRLKADKPVTIKVNIAGDLTVTTDRQHFANIVSNLIDNAVKYSPRRADITIEAGREGSEVWITVADHGMGIAAERLPYIFDKFYRVPHGNLHEVKGYGLGLYYVKTMTEKLGGEVTVESRLGQGTTFRLTLTDGDS